MGLCWRFSALKTDLQENFLKNILIHQQDKKELMLIGSGLQTTVSGVRHVEQPIHSEHLPTSFWEDNIALSMPLLLRQCSNYSHKHKRLLVWSQRQCLDNEFKISSDMSEMKMCCFVLWQITVGFCGGWQLYKSHTNQIVSPDYLICQSFPFQLSVLQWNCGFALTIRSQPKSWLIIPPVLSQLLFCWSSNASPVHPSS